MSGINEIAIVALIVAAIIFIPKITARGNRVKNDPLKDLKSKFNFSGGMRLMMASSVIWPMIAAVWLQPWDFGIQRFFLLGLLPVILIWTAYWVLKGFKK